jgi:hypothetical protein
MELECRDGFNLSAHDGSRQKIFRWRRASDYAAGLAAYYHAGIKLQGAGTI